MGIKVVKALKRNNEGVGHAAIDTLNALIQPMHDNYDLRQEQLNKVTYALGLLLENMDKKQGRCRSYYSRPTSSKTSFCL